jgi:hypothetical protein
MIFASFSTFEINTISSKIFDYYSIFQNKISLNEILKFVKDEQKLSNWCLKVLMINLWLQLENET